MNDKSLKRGYSVNDLVTMYGISRQTIYNEINNGNLKTFKIGRRRLITLRSIDMWEMQMERIASKSIQQGKYSA